MSEYRDQDHRTTSPFIGLVPTRTADSVERHLAARDSMRTSRTLMATMPVILAGSLAISGLGIIPAAASASPGQRHKAHSSDPELASATIDIASSAAAGTADSSTSTETATVQVAAVAPLNYTVRSGDTVSGIATRFGLATASVLALNGLGWKSLIFPGQVLNLVKTGTTAVAPVAAVAVTPTPAPAAASATGSYVIQKGDTISAIAKRLGVSMTALLAANNLSAASIIYAGRTLTLPGAAPTATATAAVTQVALVGAVTVPLSASMATNARTIISVGRSRGVPDYGIVIALAAAAQESGLQNLGGGDRDSVGLFQQRPSTGWGTVAQLTTPSYAAELFFGGPSNPNKGRTRGLLDIAGWQSMTVSAAAQAVQISAYPSAYAKWESSARAWLAQLG